MVFLAPTLAPTNLEMSSWLCNVRAHPRIAAPKLVFPSRPRATLCLTVVEPASRVRARLDHLR